MSQARRALLEEMLAVLESKQPDTIVSFFEHAGSGVVFLPLHPDADTVTDVKLRVYSRDGVDYVEARVEFTVKSRQGRRFTTEVICVRTASGLACAPKPKPNQSLGGGES